MAGSVFDLCIPRENVIEKIDWESCSEILDRQEIKKHLRIGWRE